MSFTEAVRSVYSKYATFEGRASRSEYWWFQLFLILVGIGLAIAGGVLLPSTRGTPFPLVFATAILIFALATLIPSLAVLGRRLHDADRSGWWFWISLVPWIGTIILFILLIMPSAPGYTRFGPVPGQPMAERWAQYWGPARSDALRQFADDAQRAAADGFQPVAQQWRWQGGAEVLDIGYSRVRPAAQWPSQPPGGYPPAS